MNPYYDQAKSALTDKYNEELAKWQAQRDVGVGMYRRENPEAKDMSDDQIVAAIRNKSKERNKPVNSNSYERKFGPNNPNSAQNKFG